MSIVAIILILISAFTHAGWNFLTKNSKPSGAFFFFSIGFAMVCISPVILLFYKKLTYIPLSVWGMLLSTGFFMAFYYFALAGAYRKGDISLAYPIARAFPILLITFISFLFGKGDNIWFWSLVGMFMVVVGMFILPIKKLNEFSFKHYFRLCCIFAFLAALGTVGYTIIDDRALSIIRTLPNTPFNPFEAAFLYLSLEGISCFLWLGLGIVIIKKERRKFFELITISKKDIKTAFIVGVSIFLSYGLVLSSMAFVKDVSYVAAFRQLSIPIGAFLGIFLLKEPKYPTRIIGVLIILIGLILVGLG
jgi:drug/metabolite transporter (DMT)-like permease